MNNMDTQAALRYHDGTKHPEGYLMDPRHVWNPANTPLLFKIYADVEAVPLSRDAPPSKTPALSAISTNVESDASTQAIDIESLSRILHFSAGITRTIKRPSGEYLFRAAACTGALYHIELYVVCGDIPGLEAGVYHYDPRESSLKRLRKGDYRRWVVDASGGESSIASAPAIIAYTDVIWRNACKYQAREYRHAYWDSGTILSNTLAVASANGVPAKVVAGFEDDSISELLGLDSSKDEQREMALALVPVGYAPDEIATPSPVVNPIDFQTLPISDYEPDFPAIREMHEASSLTSAEEVASWRRSAPSEVRPSPSGQLVPLQPDAEGDISQDSVERVITRRGSTRQFSHESITFRQLSTALERATQGISADFLTPFGTNLNDLYLIVNAVDGLASGAYVFHRDSRALELLMEGDFRQMAGHLGLNQALPADASVNVFFLSNLAPVLETFGNRGYRAAQLDASITAGRLYLSAYAQGFGATGLTFFDDDVIDFFSPHAAGKSVMFLVALGKRERRG